MSKQDKKRSRDEIIVTESRITRSRAACSTLLVYEYVGAREIGIVNTLSGRVTCELGKIIIGEYTLSLEQSGDLTYIFKLYQPNQPNDSITFTSLSAKQLEAAIALTTVMPTSFDVKLAKPYFIEKFCVFLESTLPIKLLLFTKLGENNVHKAELDDLCDLFTKLHPTINANASMSVDPTITENHIPLIQTMLTQIRNNASIEIYVQPTIAVATKVTRMNLDKKPSFLSVTRSVLKVRRIKKESTDGNKKIEPIEKNKLTLVLDNLIDKSIMQFTNLKSTLQRFVTYYASKLVESQYTEVFQALDELRGMYTPINDALKNFKTIRNDTLSSPEKIQALTPLEIHDKIREIKSFKYAIDNRVLELYAIVKSSVPGESTMEMRYVELAAGIERIHIHDGTPFGGRSRKTGYQKGGAFSGWPAMPPSKFVPIHDIGALQAECERLMAIATTYRLSKTFLSTTLTQLSTPLDQFHYDFLEYSLAYKRGEIIDALGLDTGFLPLDDGLLIYVNPYSGIVTSADFEKFKIQFPSLVPGSQSILVNQALLNNMHKQFPRPQTKATDGILVVGGKNTQTGGDPTLIIKFVAYFILYFLGALIMNGNRVYIKLKDDQDVPIDEVNKPNDIPEKMYVNPIYQDVSPDIKLYLNVLFNRIPDDMTVHENPLFKLPPVTSAHLSSPQEAKPFNMWPGSLPKTEFDNVIFNMVYNNLYEDSPHIEDSPQAGGKTNKPKQSKQSPPSSPSNPSSPKNSNDGSKITNPLTGRLISTKGSIALNLLKQHAIGSIKLPRKICKVIKDANKK